MKAEMKREPKERPILFSGEMVRRILAGDKMQTRRVIKHQPNDKGLWPRGTAPGEYETDCPYGAIGDRLWVREKVALCMPQGDFPRGIAYFATDSHRCSPHIKWCPSIHMPREASRITLEITNVRVERLEDISEGDAEAEGVQIPVTPDGSWLRCISKKYVPEAPTFREHFRMLWEEINGKKHPWNSNPWVWVIEFKKV